MGFKARTHAAVALIQSDRGQELVTERISEIDAARAALEAERGQLLALVGAIETPTTRRARRKVSRERVTARLNEAGPLSAAQLANVLNAKPERVRPVLRELLDEGAIEKLGRGRGTRYGLA